MKHSLKGLIVVTILSLGLWLGWSQYQDFLYQGASAPEGTQILNKMEKEGVPNFELKDGDGKSYSLDQFKDKIVIVNFWASWCDPCVEEFPSLVKLIQHFKGEVVLLAVSADYTLEDMNIFLRAFEATKEEYIISLWDKDQNVAKSFGTKILPESYILGRGNKLIRKIAGIDKWYDKDAIAFFEDLVKLSSD